MGRGRGVGGNLVAVAVADGVGDGVQPPGQSDGVGVTPGVAVGVGLGGRVAVGVALAVAVGVGVGRSQIIWTVSILQPSPEVLLSLPIRHRRTMVCPAKPVRSTSVSMKPPELPVHAWRPASGLPQQVLIVPL